MRIAADLDGVICDFIASMRTHGNKLWPGRFPEKWSPLDYDFTDIQTPTDTHELFQYMADTATFWYDLPELPGALTLHNWLHTPQSMGHDIYYITSRFPTTKGLNTLAQTSKWLRRRQLLDIGTSVCVVPHAADKPALMDALNIDIMIDDKPETVELSCHDRPSYLLDCTWNRKPEHMHLKRVFSVEEFLRKVDTLNSSPELRSFR